MASFIVYLGLGSNLGDRLANLNAAVEALDSRMIGVTRVSPIYESEPIGVTPEPVPNYLNCVVRANTELPADALLDTTQAIERELGRNPTFRWGPRSIDIDILLYGSVSLESGRLSLPHPRMKERLFVLRPLADLEPDLVLPGSERISELLAEPAVAMQRIWTATTS